MKRTVAGFATGVFAVIAIGTAPPAAAGPDSDFLAALTEGGLSVPAAASGRVVSAGHAICANFDSGGSYQAAISSVAGAMGGNSSMAGTFVRAAVKSFCPKYVSQFP
jgi:hypothetical protein